MASPSIDRIAGPVLAALADAPDPDQSLRDVERFLDAVPDRAETLQWLEARPRAIEILTRLFVGSPSLSELLVREPNRLQWLTDHRGLTEFPSREEFIDASRAEIDAERTDGSASQLTGIIQRYQRREILRIAACDAFHLVDLKTSTRQLSLLADAMVQVILEEHARLSGIDPNRLSVLAFGKLGGLELNYSSDIDLLFLGETGGSDETALAQHTIRSLSEVGPEGFLYRVDMRLRPWGRSGPLVVTGERYLDYLGSTAELWEKQAILKARVVAGDGDRGDRVLAEAMPIIFGTPVAQVRANVLAMKDKIERSLHRRGRSEGHVKSGEGGIRDIEFVTQFLQLVNGGESPSVRTPNTAEALLRLFDAGAIESDQYRALSAGYVFHRVIEHALQLRDMSARHALPTHPREIDHLARRLDYPSAEVFLKHYRGHCTAVRGVFNQIVGDASIHHDVISMRPTLGDAGDPSYREAFPNKDRVQHRAMAAQLSDRVVVISSETLAPASIQAADASSTDLTVELTVVGRDQPGNLALIAGLLLVYGFSVESADAFPSEMILGDEVGPTLHDSRGKSRSSWFVDKFIVSPMTSQAAEDLDSSALWTRFEAELARRMEQLAVNAVETHADVAWRVADAVREAHGDRAAERLLPIEVIVDDQRDSESTIIQIRTDDSPGVLFNLTTALSLDGTGHPACECSHRVGTRRQNCLRYVLRR